MRHLWLIRPAGHPGQGPADTVTGARRPEPVGPFSNSPYELRRTFHPPGSASADWRTWHACHTGLACPASITQSGPRLCGELVGEARVGGDLVGERRVSRGRVGAGLAGLGGVGAWLVGGGRVGGGLAA
jgi:hypothetical protein